MVIIQKSYQKLKQQYGDIIARELLLECYEQSGHNKSETSRRMRCNRRTVNLALNKQNDGNLVDASHRPRSQPNQTSKEIEEKVLYWRGKTKGGKKKASQNPPRRRKANYTDIYHRQDIKKKQS